MIAAVFLFLLAIASFAYACLVSAVAKSAIHEIEANLGFLISAILLSAAILVEQVRAARKASEQTRLAIKEADEHACKNSLLIAKLMQMLVDKADVPDLHPMPPALDAASVALAAHTYYIATDGRTVGPYNEMHVRKLLRAGGIDANTPAMRNGDHDWRTVGAILTPNG